MLDKIIELLLGLAVAVAGAVGIGTATTAPQADAGTDTVAWAHAQGGERSAAHMQKAGPDDAAAASSDATAAALVALEEVMVAAPDAATDGLDQAWQRVSQAGPPEDVPVGPPDGVLPADAGRP